MQPGNCLSISIALVEVKKREHAPQSGRVDDVSGMDADRPELEQIFLQHFFSRVS
jgi:hypothetical protein